MPFFKFSTVTMARWQLCWIWIDRILYAQAHTTTFLFFSFFFSWNSLTEYCSDFDPVDWNWAQRWLFAISTVCRQHIHGVLYIYCASVCVCVRMPDPLNDPLLYRVNSVSTCLAFGLTNWPNEQIINLHTKNMPPRAKYVSIHMNIAQYILLYYIHTTQYTPYTVYTTYSYSHLGSKINYNLVKEQRIDHIKVCLVLVVNIWCVWCVCVCVFCVYK